MQNSSLNDYLKNVVNKAKELADTPARDVVNAAVEASKTPVGKYDTNNQALNTAIQTAGNTTNKTLPQTPAGGTTAVVAEEPKNSSITDMWGNITTAGNGSGGGVDSALQAYLNELERQRAERQAMLDAQYKQGKNNIENSAANSNRQAYIAYMNGLKNMPQAAAMYGSGGMAQSLANKSQMNYENNRNNIETAKLASLTDLESDYRAGVLDAGNDYLEKLANVKQKTVTGAGTVADGSSAGKTYTVDKLGITAADEVELYKKLMAAGLSQSEAEEYLINQGIVSKPSYGTPKR